MVLQCFSNHFSEPHLISVVTQERIQILKNNRGKLFKELILNEKVLLLILSIKKNI